MFYDQFLKLCKQKDVSPSRATLDAGISKSLVTKWKNNRTEIPSPEVLNKLSRYFCIPVSELLGEETAGQKTQTGHKNIEDKDIMFALFGGEHEITDAMYEEVRDFARFVLQWEAAKTRKELFVCTEKANKKLFLL